MKNKSILLVVAILLIGLSLAGGTYAYLTMAASITNGNYNTQTTCFNIDYNISNEGSGQDISGTLFPSANASGGLSGRVGLKANASCGLNGLGTLKLHINSSTSSNLMTSASSYCQDRKTLEPISGITTESACTTAGGRWRGYGDAYCESNSTLERLTTPTDSESCTSAGGTWKTGGSPLKYAVYDNNAGTGIPLAKGYIESTDINTDKVIYDNFIIDTNQKYYYIFIWIDGYLVDNAINDLPFSGSISANANQANVRIIYRYGESAVQLGQRIVLKPTQAWCANSTEYGNSCDFGWSWETQSECEAYVAEQNMENTVCEQETVQPISYETDPLNLNKTFYLKHVIVDDITTESYVGFIVTPAMAQANPGMTAGTYYLRGLDTFDTSGNCKSQYLNNTTGNCESPYYEANKSVLQSAFGSTYCNETSSRFECHVSGLNPYADVDGPVRAFDYSGPYCEVIINGNSDCSG